MTRVRPGTLARKARKERAMDRVFASAPYPCGHKHASPEQANRCNRNVGVHP